jgi:phosphohistidine swiveling domain-containing protein
MVVVDETGGTRPSCVRRHAGLALRRPTQHPLALYAPISQSALPRVTAHTLEARFAAALSNATFNILLPLVGGIVTDNGGLLAHAAIVAREYGIPVVVGTREATKRIQDGDRLRVDGDAGKVRALG